MKCIWMVGGRGSSDGNANRDESVETGDESVEPGINLWKLGKPQQSFYNFVQC